MRKFLLLITTVAFLTSCNNTAAKTEEATTDTTTAKADVVLPYTPSYSSSFKMGNPEYSAMILQGSWKDWEANTMDNMKSWIADTITAFHSDNTMVKGADS